MPAKYVPVKTVEECRRFLPLGVLYWWSTNLRQRMRYVPCTGWEDLGYRDWEAQIEYCNPCILADEEEDEDG
jgi:hypothetical protein